MTTRGWLPGLWLAANAVSASDSGMSQRSSRFCAPIAVANAIMASIACCPGVASMRRFVNSHWKSFARARSKPSRMVAGRERTRRLARSDACMHKAISNCLPASARRTSRYAALPRDLSKTTKSMSGMSDISVASVLPMIQVMRASGQLSCSRRTTASAWQVSPIAESRRTQMCSGFDCRSKSGNITSP